MFTEEDDTTIILNKKKCYILLNFASFKELQEKRVFSKIAARTARLFECGWPFCGIGA